MHSVYFSDRAEPPSIQFSYIIPIMLLLKNRLAVKNGTAPMKIGQDENSCESKAAVS